MIGNAQLCILIQPRGSRSRFISITSPTLSLLSEELFVPGLWSPSLGCEGYLVSPISPTLCSLCFSHLCSTSPSSRVRGDGEEVVRGVCALVKKQRTVRRGRSARAPCAGEQQVLGYNGSWHCSDGRRGAATQGQGEGPLLEGICS